MIESIDRVMHAEAQATNEGSVVFELDRLDALVCRLDGHLAKHAERIASIVDQRPSTRDDAPGIALPIPSCLIAVRLREYSDTIARLDERLTTLTQLVAL